MADLEAWEKRMDDHAVYSETEYAKIAQKCDALTQDVLDATLDFQRVRKERDEMLDQCQAVEKAITVYRLTAEREAVATKFANEQLFKMRADRDRWKQLRMDALDSLSYWQAELARMWLKGAMRDMTDHWAFNMLSQRHVLFEDRANKLAAKQGRNKPAVPHGG
jgi:hypothetical protein